MKINENDALIPTVWLGVGKVDGTKGRVITGKVGYTDATSMI